MEGELWGSSRAQESLSLGPEPQGTDPVSGLESKHGRVLSLKESALKLPEFRNKPCSVWLLISSPDLPPIWTPAPPAHTHSHVPAAKTHILSWNELLTEMSSIPDITRLGQ